MKIDILTLFPNMFDGVLNESIIKRALDSNKVEVNIINIRDYSTDPHKKVDDYSYGGGAGMVLMPQPIFDAVKANPNIGYYIVQGDKDNTVDYKRTSQYEVCILTENQ